MTLDQIKIAIKLHWVRVKRWLFHEIYEERCDCEVACDECMGTGWRPIVAWKVHL